MCGRLHQIAAGVEHQLGLSLRCASGRARHRLGRAAAGATARARPRVIWVKAPCPDALAGVLVLALRQPASRASASMKRGLTPSWHAGMQLPPARADRGPALGRLGPGAAGQQKVGDAAHHRLGVADVEPGGAGHSGRLRRRPHSGCSGRGPPGCGRRARFRNCRAWVSLSWSPRGLAEAPGGALQPRYAGDISRFKRSRPMMSKRQEAFRGRLSAAHRAALQRPGHMSC